MMSLINFMTPIIKELSGCIKEKYISFEEGYIH